MQPNLTNRAKIRVKKGPKRDFGAEISTVSQLKLPLSEFSKRNGMSQVTEGAGLNPSVQYFTVGTAGDANAS